MRTLVSHLSTGSRSVSYLVGVAVIFLAVAVSATSQTPGEVANWALNVFGIAFLTVFSLLIFAGFYCWNRIISDATVGLDRMLWIESGLHVANGLSTLALTFTLLGISLGIGTLATTELTPETVQNVIGVLTGHFSMAFMTTVVGLPAAAGMRALIGISAVKYSVQDPENEPVEGDSYAIHGF